MHLRKFTHSVILLALAAVSFLPARAIDLVDEQLHYVVTYKWGFINKDAANATLSLRNDGEYYRATLAASTLPWADKILTVRDTLISTMERPSCFPIEYQKITHEGSRYGNDVVRFSRQGNEVTGYASRERSKNGGPLTTSETTLHATGPTLDMLSVFYYIRTLDFPAMKPGDKVTVNVFSGKNSEQLIIAYLGNETITYNGRTWPTSHLSFSFNIKGQVSSDAMETWISTDDMRIPVKLQGALPIGKVHAYYTGATPD